jgi:hypothetical protein
MFLLLSGRVGAKRAEPALAVLIWLFERKHAGQDLLFHGFADTIAQILASLAEDGRLLIRLVPKMLTGVE